MSASAAGATRPPSRTLSALGRLLETAIEHALSLDPDSRARVAALDGRSVTLRFRGTSLALRATVRDARLQIGPARDGASELELEATPGTWLAMAAARGGGVLPPGRVQIAGDAELARRLEQILGGFAPDTDEAFARVFGDVAGFQLARLARRGAGWARAAARALVRDGADYLVEEDRSLVARAEMESFLDEVDALREGSDRLHARVRRLAERAGGAAS
ncbi:MAG TPA: SCP2 sterol-binding domain-containing protein [Dokdonella sp.]|uniref:ubiquinone biosynthesis accessory factor UbiJ n=1 Tax=Dokdonella sp. TaxID=2291710 RepID=UPI002D0EEBC6|nr:SCP2 sterol-binding domain-containing protein [Dokdonella sp.]HUD42855.1 SCP2 sterol-binding domain-containing protein [Dokdonella sp.]